MAGEAEWESLPDVAEVPAAAEWESLPDIVEPEPIQPFVSPILPPPEDSAIAESRRALLRTAFEVAKSKEGSTLTRSVEVAKRFNVPVRQVQPNLAEFERLAELSKFDPDAFYKDNKLLVDVMIGNPEQLATVVESPTVGPLIRLFRQIEDSGLLEAQKEFEKWTGAGFIFSGPENFLRQGKRLVSQLQGVDVEAEDEKAAAEAQTEREKRRNAKVQKFDTPEAQAIRATEGLTRTALTLKRRYQEARAATDMSYAGFELALTENNPLSTEDEVAQAAAKVQNLRAASRPLALGEGEALGVTGEALQGVLSTVDNLLARGTAASAAAGVGLIAGAVSTKSPSGAAAGARGAASLGQRVGGVYQGFKAETGSKYLELREAVTDEGQRLSKAEALGGAVAYGVVAAYLENLGFQAATAPMANALRAQTRRLLLRDPLFRSRVAALGKEWVKGAATEGLTEGLQSSFDQLVEYIVKSEKDWKLQNGPAINPEQAIREGQAGLLAGGGVSAVSTVGAIGVEALKADKEALTSPQQVAIISTLAGQEPVRASPEAFAEVVRRATDEAGSPVREFWVDVGATQRLFQEQGKDDAAAAAAIEELAGPEAADSYRDAVAQGGRFAVPLERALSSWSTSDIGKQLLEHTATTETAPTPSQVSKEMEAVRAHADELVKQAEEAAADEVAFDDALEKMRRDLVEAARATNGIKDAARVGRDSVQLVRAWYETAKADNPNLTWKQLLERAGILEFSEGDNADSTKQRVQAWDAPARLLSFVLGGGRDGTALSREDMARLLFVDDVTGLRTSEAWDALGKREGMQVAVITTPDAKAINDNPDGSHDATNALLARIGSMVARVDSEAGRAGTNFLLQVADQQSLDAVLEQIRAALPTGLTVFGALGGTRQQAGAALDAQVDAARASGTLPPRGSTAFDTSLLKSARFDEGVSTPATDVTDAELSVVDEGGQLEDREKWAARAFLDPQVPGLLSRLGFLHSGQAKHSVAMDLRGLKDLNTLFGKEAGDAMIKAFGEALVRTGGSAFAAAHMSGDEYALKSDSKVALEEFIADLEAELLDAGFRLSGQSMPPIKFRWGIGETYGRADQDLNRRKQAEAASGISGVVRETDSDGRHGGVHSSVDEGSPGANARGAPDGDNDSRARSVEQRKARAERRRGGEPTRPFGTLRPEGDLDGGGFDSFGEGVGRDAGGVTGEVLADEEDIASARADVARMRNVERKARFTQFLDYLEGKGPRGEDSQDGKLVAGLLREEQLRMVREWGLDDPKGSFLDTPRLLGFEGRKGKRDPNAKKSGFKDRGLQELERARVDEMNRARGRKGRNDRLYQSEAERLSKNLKLSDGRTALIRGRWQDSTRVAVVDLEKVTNLLKTAKEKWSEETSRQLNSRRIESIAANVADVFIGPAIIKLDAALREVAELSESGEALRDARKLIEGTEVSMTEARTGEHSWALSDEDQAALLVALDQFESETGRLQQDEANLRGSARGYFEKPPPGAEGVARVMRVFLNKGADASTVFHESAHGFLEMLNNLASAEDAGQRTKEQFAATLKWLGVESFADVKREQHEKWARAFEAYLREGKAPSKGLWGVFNRFKSWLMRVYKTVAQLNVELDDDIRRIFDRMLATDKEIARALGRRGGSPWTSAKDAGMTETQWQEYQQEQEEDRAFATRDAEVAFLKGALRDAEKDFSKVMAQAREDAATEFEELPARRAQRFLDGTLAKGMEQTVLDRSEVERAVGGTAVRRFKTKKQGGVSPDDVAAMTGYATGREMLQAIASIPNKDRWIESRAKALVEERDSAGAQELERLRQMVDKGVQDYVEKRLLREWAELGRRAEPTDDVSHLGRVVAMETLRHAGKQLAERELVRRINPNRNLMKERQASKQVRDASAKGDMVGARDWFRQQSLQAFAHRASQDAQEFIQRFEKLAEQLSESDSRAKLGLAAPALRDAVDYLLGSFGLAPETEFAGDTLQAAAQLLEESGTIPGDWLRALETPELLGSGDYRNLRVEQLRHVDAALRQLKAEAQFRNEVILGEKRADKAATKAALLQEATEVLPKRTPPGTRSSDTIVERLLSTANALDGFLLNPADMVRDLTGDNIDSTWWKAIIEPLRQAKTKEIDFLKRAVQPITDAIESMPDSVKRRMRDSVDGKSLFPNHIDALLPRQRHELLMMALNVGNRGNLQRLLDGRNITQEQVERALDALTDEELAWVEKVWAAVAELKEDAFALEERETGLRPKGVESTPFRLPSGRVLKGGYFPAVYDRRASVLGEKQQANAVASLLDPRFIRPGTSHGHLKQRQERIEDAALSLDLSVIYRHLAQVAHDLAFREPVKSVGQLILDPEIQQAMRERLGESKARSFLQWLKDVGGNTGADVTPGDAIVAWARGAGAHVLLGWNTATALGDFANLPAAIASTPLKTKHLAAGLRDFMRSPTAAREVVAAISPWMRTMKDTTRKQFDQSMKTLLDRPLPKPLQWYKENAFFLMETVNVATATPVWLGSYRQAVAEGRTEADAVRFADDIVSRVFLSHSPVDQAAILRDRGFWGRVTVFYGYLSTLYRAQHRAIAPLFEQDFLDAAIGGKVKTIAKVAGSVVGLHTAASVLGELLMGRGPEEGDDDEDDPGNQLKRWRNWYVRKLVAGPLSTQPFAPIQAAFEAYVTGKISPSPRGSPIQSMVAMFGKQLFLALDGDNTAVERIAASLKLVMEGLGLPVAPIDKQGKFLVDVVTGQASIEDVGDLAGGLLYGARQNQPANVAQPFKQ